MMAVATAAVAIDGIDPALLAPVVCLLVGLVLGTLLGLALSAREVARLKRRIGWIAKHLDKECSITIDGATDGPWVRITVEVPE